MRIRAKTYISDLVSVDSIVTVYYFHLHGAAAPDEIYNFWEFQYVDQGSWAVQLDGKRYAMEEGQIILFPPDSRHNGPGPGYSAHVGIVSFESSSPILLENQGRVITLSGKLRELLSDIITQGVDLFVPASPESGLKGVVPRAGVTTAQLQVLKHKLELFLTELCTLETGEKTVGSNQSNYQKSQFEEIEAFLKANLDKNFSLEELSGIFSVSPSKLKNIFREAGNTSPMAYFTSLKMQRAKQLIRESAMSVAQIAESLGFRYENYFSRVFKEKTGLTPSEYAKSIFQK